jgi:Carboxypeptidase regulatory-like domain
MRKISRDILLLITFLLAATGLGFAQALTSSIVGHVTDTSEAVVPGAQIVVTNQGTGIQVKTTTGSGGTYTVTNLYAGVYKIQVTKSGFQGFQITEIDVLASQTVRQDVVLKVGAVQQSVTVSGRAPLIHSDSMTVSGEITTDQLHNLPVAILSVDRFMSLVPGGQSGGNPQIGGSSYWGGTNFTINGGAANDFTNGRGLGGYGTGLVGLPAITSMQEFKVDVSSMNAEYRSQTAVQMVTKSGANQFHGELYEFNRNAKLAANTLTLNAAGIPRQPYNLNQFGGNLGGPILRNKAFFFFNFSGFRQRQYNTVQLNFPSGAMRQGDFGALCATYANGICTDPGGTQLYDPYTGAAFSNNVIPPSMITSQSNTLISYLPPLTASSPGLPNGAPNYVGSVSVPKNFDDYDLRLDYQLSAKDSLMGYYNHNRGYPWFQPLGTPPNYGNGSDFGYKTVMYMVGETHIFGSNTVNDVRLRWLNFPQNRSGQNLDFNPTSLFPQQEESDQRGLPDMNFLGYNPIGDFGSRHLSSYQPSLEILENITHVHGRHTLKAGADLAGYIYYKQSSYAQLPKFSFNGEWTGNNGNPGQPQSVGNAFADFLLGAADSSSTSYLGHDQEFYNKDWELYFQDTWQATRKLTVYLGVRYMNERPWTMRDNLWSTWDINSNKIIIPQDSATPTFGYGMAPQLFNAFLPYYTTTKAVGLPINWMNNDTNNWGPRIGVAFRPFANGMTVLRGGYGIYYSPIAGEGIPLDSTLGPPWTGGNSGDVSTALTFTTQLPGAPTSQFLPDITFSDPFPSSGGGLGAAPASPTFFPMELNFVLPITQSWNLTVERQLGTSDMVRVSYVGSQTHHMTWLNSEINVPSVQTPNVPLQAQRPLGPWGSIQADRSGGKQNFNQLQLEYIRRFARGLSFQAEYAWTSALTNDPYPVGGPQLWQYPSLGYGNNYAMPRHRLVFNYIYSLPVGRGRRYMGNAPPVVNGFLGGWQVSGITSYQTGLPLAAINFQVPSSYVGWWGGLADRVSGINLYDKRSGHDITNGVQWFNPAAFAPPQQWQWGNSQPYSVWGPGSSNWDISVQKNFGIPIPRLETPQLEFRADFFDAFNHFNLGNPSTTIGDTRDGGSPITTTGKIYGGSGNRTIQLGLRLQF